MKLSEYKKTTVYFVAVVILVILSCPRQGNKNELPWDKLARKDMVYSQIVARGISDKNVINAMLKVERHKFVPKEYEKLAYGDFPLPIAEGQTISQPYIVALMTEKIEPGPADKVLEVGTGSGYQAAVLSLLVNRVYTIEIIESLAKTAAQRLAALGFLNIEVRHGDGFLGWPEAAPFDAVIITCAPPKLPQPLVEQLAEGGRLIVPLGEDFQMLTLYRKIDGNLEKEEITPVLFVPMKGIIEEE